MRKRQMRNLIGLWSDAGQMMLDSAQVIAIRTQLMLKTSHSAADRRELTRMVNEKVAAAQEAAIILSRAMVEPANLTGVLGKSVKPFAKRARANARRLARGRS